PGKLRQMLFNLLENAVKFTNSGRIAVRVKRHGELIDFEVQDTGIGVSRENQRLIFDPFWQVTQSTTRAAGGSGLGLSVTRRLAELLGGTVGVESEPGKGSTFRITLPRALRLVNAEGEKDAVPAPRWDGRRRRAGEPARSPPCVSAASTRTPGPSLDAAGAAPAPKTR